VQEAWDIYQCHLDRMTRAVWERDWATVRRCIALPVRTKTAGGVRHDATADGLVDDLRGFRDAMETMGTTAYYRICQAAAFADVDRTRIGGCHRTYVLRGGNYVEPPYDCEMKLVSRDGHWLMSSVDVRSNRLGTMQFRGRRDPAG
jgi:hypothetical protein